MRGSGIPYSPAEYLRSNPEQRTRRKRELHFGRIWLQQFPRDITERRDVIGVWRKIGVADVRVRRRLDIRQYGRFAAVRVAIRNPDHL